MSAPTFRSGGYHFVVTGEPDLVHAVTGVFHDMADEQEDPAHTWRLESRGDACTLIVNGQVAFEGVSRARVTGEALSVLTERTLDHEPQLLHFHAMAVLDGETALVAAGPSGSGKSTLCAALTGAGCAYMTDEAIGVDPRTFAIAASRKPISVKQFAVSAVARLTGAPPPDDGRATWEIVASELGKVAPPGPTAATTVVSYRYDADAPVTVSSMHRARLARLLLTDSQDAARFGPDSLLVTARFVAGARCLEASGRDTVAVAERVLDHHRTALSAGSLMVVGPAADGPGPLRSPETVSVLLDGRALVMDRPTGRLVELDEAASLWWMLLDGTALSETATELTNGLGTSRHQVQESGRRLLDHLAEIGLVRIPA